MIDKKHLKKVPHVQKPNWRPAILSYDFYADKKIIPTSDKSKETLLVRNLKTLRDAAGWEMKFRENRAKRWEIAAIKKSKETSQGASHQDFEQESSESSMQPKRCNKTVQFQMWCQVAAESQKLKRIKDISSEK